MKKQNILFDNYNNIYKKYFKFNLSELFKQNEEKPVKLFSIHLEEETSSFQFFTEEKYLYLFYEKNELNLDKNDIEKKEVIFEKKLKYADDFCVLNDKKNNKIKLLLYNDSKFELIVLNKNYFSIIKEYKIDLPELEKEKKEFKLNQIINSKNYFYIITNDSIYLLDLATNKFKLLFQIEKTIQKNKSYFYIFDDLIFFNETDYIDLKKKKYFGKNDESKKDDSREYFEISKGTKYSLINKKKKKEI